MNKYLKDGASFWEETEDNAFCLSLWCYIRDQAKAWLSWPAPHCANLAPGRLMGWLQRINSRSKRTNGIGREGERYLFLVACAAARLLSLSLNIEFWWHRWSYSLLSMTYYTCSNLASPLTPHFHCAHGFVVHACQDTFFFFKRNRQKSFPLY